MPEMFLKSLHMAFAGHRVKNFSLVIADGDLSHCGAFRLRQDYNPENDCRSGNTDRWGAITIDGKESLLFRESIDISPDKRDVGFLFQN